MTIPPARFSIPTDLRLAIAIPGGLRVGWPVATLVCFGLPPNNIQLSWRSYVTNFTLYSRGKVGLAALVSDCLIVYLT